MKNKKILMMILAVILLSGVIFLARLITQKDVVLDDVKLTDMEKDKLAIMVEQLDGTYAESDAYPTGNYMLDEDLSGCIDKNGKAIANSVSYSNGTVSFKTNSSSYCYVYFSKLTLVKYLLNEDTRPSSLWTSTLDGDGYRFVGTDPSNYICFGMEDKDTCVGNTDLYMYRIIGIFEDSDGKQYVKLIKKEALDTAYAWYDSYLADANWGTGGLYTNLNGSYFLNNTTYSYMQNTIWSSKIKDWTWSAVNTLTYANSGPNYQNTATTSQIYYHEMNHANKSNLVGEWTTPSGMIGLMYVSDYMMSLGESSLSYIGWTNRATLKTGWMQLTTIEWTMSRYDETSDGLQRAWGINLYGYAAYYSVNETRSVRPVFYLVSSEEYLSGTGTTDDPFVLNGRPKYTVTINSNNDSYGEISLTSSIVYEGDTVIATIEPGSIYKYSSNDCGVTVSDNTLTIPNVTSNVNCTVTFVEKPKYTVNVSSNNTSYGTVSPASQTVYEGNSATVTLSPQNGYVYLEDSCGGTRSGNILTIKNISGNKSCTVTFGQTSLGQYLLDYKLGTDGLNNSLETNSYRYKGTADSVNNYVCFGTNDKDTCTSDTDKYVYMIMGVQSDGTIELIKKEALNNAYSWTGDSTYFITYAESPIYHGLNMSYFLTNTSFSYMTDVTWFNKIKTVNWSYYTNSDWDISYVTAKVGLMNSFEYDYSYSSSYSTSWLNLANRDSGAPSTQEMTDTWLKTSSYPWYLETIDRYGTGSAKIDEDISVRPVFFLKSTVIYASGTGTLTDPYILSHAGDQTEQSEYSICLLLTNNARPDSASGYSYCAKVSAGGSTTIEVETNGYSSSVTLNGCVGDADVTSETSFWGAATYTIENVQSDVVCSATA